MRQRLWILSLVLPICGCYVSQPSPVYAPQAYPAPPPGYPPPYPGYSYNDGEPTIIEEGAPVPLIFFGGEWGFYDHGHHWHRAPEGVYRDLDRRHAEGGFAHPGALPPPDAGRPGWHPPPEAGRPGWHQPPEAGRPGWHPPPGAGLPPPNHAGPPPGPGGPPPERHEEHHHDCAPGQRC